MNVVVECASRSQLLEVVTTLPQELRGMGSKVDYSTGTVRFTKKDGFPGSWAKWDFDGGLKTFVTDGVHFQKPLSEEQTARLPQVLSKGIIPATIAVYLDHHLESFGENLLPILLQTGYVIRSANFGTIEPDSRRQHHEWRVDSVDLFPRRQKLRDEYGREREPIMRMASGNPSGWVGRMLESNRQLFYFKEMKYLAD